MKIKVLLSYGNRNVETQALIDCGAKGANYISRSFTQQNRIPLIPLKKPIPVLNVDGTDNCGGAITDYVRATIEVKKRVCELLLLVTSLGRETVILGYPWLRQENPDINWKKQTLTWRTPESYRIKTIGSLDPRIEDIQDNSLVISAIQGKMTDEARETWMKTRMSHSQLFALEDEKKKARPKEEIVPIEFHKYLDTVFSEREIGTLPSRSKYDHKIDLKEGFIPKRGALFRQGPEQDQATREFLDENLAKGFIRESKSPQAATLFFVPKKDGRTRPVQDYRYLNDWTVKNAYPLPRIEDLIDRLIGKKLFIKMDVRWGYNNVRIHEGDEWKAAFICKHGLYEPLVMFFGLTNSPATFQSMMDEIFHSEILQGWLNDYLDDILIANEGDKEDLTKKATGVLDKLEEHELFIKPDKSEFFTTSVDFLGFNIGDGKINMEKQKVSGIADWPPPQNQRQVRSFIGFCNFYRRFIKDYAEFCKPLNDLLRKTTIWDWTDERHAAFEKLKAVFLSQPVLVIPDYTKPFIIEADASLFATGAVLLQEDSNGEEHPAGYLSLSLNPAERNYQVYDREFLAIIRALREWKHYIKDPLPSRSSEQIMRT
jgi:hypothetical protein